MNGAITPFSHLPSWRARRQLPSPCQTGRGLELIAAKSRFLVLQLRAAQRNGGASVRCSRRSSCHPGTACPALRAVLRGWRYDLRGGG